MVVTASPLASIMEVVDEATARAWLAEEGFVEGDLRSEIIINERMWCLSLIHI